MSPATIPRSGTRTAVIPWAGAGSAARARSWSWPRSWAWWSWAATAPLIFDEPDSASVQFCVVQLIDSVLQIGVRCKLYDSVHINCTQLWINIGIYGGKKKNVKLFWTFFYLSLYLRRYTLMIAMLTLRFCAACVHLRMSLLQPVSYNPSNPEHHTETRISTLQWHAKDILRLIIWDTINVHVWIILQLCSYTIDYAEVENVSCALLYVIHYVPYHITHVFPSISMCEILSFTEKKPSKCPVCPLYLQCWIDNVDNMCSNLVSAIDATFLFMQFNL